MGVKFVELIDGMSGDAGEHNAELVHGSIFTRSQAVANTEDGDTGGEQGGIDGGASGVVDAGGAARDDDAFPASQGGRGRFAGGYFGVDA